MTRHWPNCETSSTIKLSVIVPAFNAEKYLAETLNSVLAQTFRDFEVIVVDDGSTDNTCHIVHVFREASYVYQTNRGPAAARNVGLQLAKGEYVAFLDADDMWHPNMLSSCVQMLDHRPDIGAVHTNWQYIDSEGARIARTNNWRPLRGNIFEQLLVEITLTTSAIVWRREWWDRIGGHDETPEVNDDWLNWLRMAKLGCQFEYIEQPLVLRRRHDQSLTRLQSKRVIEWRLRALDMLCQEYTVPAYLSARAYGEAWWIATVDAVQRHNYDEAANCLIKALQHNPQILDRDSTYWAIGFPDASLLRTETLDLTQGQSNLEHILGQVFGSSELPSQLIGQRQRAFSTAYQCLARAAYGQTTYPSSVARRFLLKACRYDLQQTLHAKNLTWAGRILVGSHAIGLAKQVLVRLPVLR